MKKFLLTMACALGLMTASAETVSFDFSTSAAASAYGIPVDKNTYVTNPTDVTSGAVTLTFDGSAADAWRWWDDGMRAYGKSAAKKPTLTVSVNGGTITNIEIDFTKTGATYTANEGTWTLNTDKKGGVWTGDNASVTLAMTASSNIAACNKITVTYTGGQAPAIAAPKVSCADNTVTITADGADAIYYTINGTEPTNASAKYTAPFAITENTTVKAIAYKGADKSNVTTFNAQYVGNYADFASFVAANTTGTVDGPIAVAYQSSDKRYTYLKDSKGGWMLAYTANSTNDNPVLANGDVLASITGQYSPYRQLPELIPSAWGTATKGAAVQPTEVSVEELSTDMVNEYIVIKNVKISGLNGRAFTIEDETGSVAGYNSINTADIVIPEGEGFTFYGFVSRNNADMQITPINVVGGEVMETVATPTFSVESGAVAAGTTVEISCATEGAAIFYTLDNTEPTAASTLYDGALTISENTTLKAIAIKEGMIDSAVAEAMYTILDPNATEATFDFSDVKAFAPDFTLPTEASTGTDIAGMSFTNNGVTLTFAENEAANKARIWLQTGGDTQLRVYTTDSFTVSVANGMTIESIEFAFPGSNYTRLATTVGNFAVATDGKTGEWTPEETATPKATATVPFTITKNARINSMKVVYKKDPSAVENIAVDDNEAPAEYFNLQGVRVANPTPGLYIVRQGNKTSKVLVK